MANKNFVIRNQNTDGTWDVLYPRTSAQQVVTTDDQQFISATKIAEFEAKASTAVATTEANGLMSKEDKAIVAGVAQGLADNLEAAKTYTNEEIAKLVDSAPDAVNTLGELATALATHEGAYEALLEVVGGKATKQELTDGLALKADQQAMTDALALKADAQALTDGLALKADKTYVDEQLALKANAQETTEALAAKASTLQLNEGLALKADKTQVATDIADAIAAAGVTTVVVGSTEPTEAKPGDFWYEIVE